MPSRRSTSRTPDWCKRLAERLGQVRLGLLSLLLIGLPFGLGGRADWVLPAVGLVNAVALALLILELAGSRRRPRWHAGWLVAGLLWLGLWLQLLPAASLVNALSPQAATLWQRAREAGFTDLTACLSLTPARTRVALVMLGQIGLTGWLVYNTFTTRRRLVLLSVAVAGAALANALGAFLPTFAGGTPLYADLGIKAKPLSGTFLNRNHFGCLLGLGLIQLAGLAWTIYRSRETRPHREGYRQHSLDDLLDRHRGPWLLLLALAAVPVAMGLLFSLSRGAAIGTVAGLLGFLVVGPRGSHGRTRWTLLAGSGLFLAAILIGAIEALTDLWDRYEALVTLGNIGLDGRWVIWRETLELLRRFPLCGIGLDAFERVSPWVESGFAAGRISFHAHNDYLEWLAEVGLPLGLVGLGLLLIAMVQLGRRVLRTRDALCRTLGLAAWWGLFAVALHEGVDYSLRAPANAFLAVSLAVLCLLASELGGDVRHRPRPTPAQPRRPEPRSRGPLARLGLAAAALAILALAAWHYPPQVQAGTRALALRRVIGATADIENTGAARKTQATYCLGEAQAVLRVLPDHERALQAQAAYQQELAADLSQARAAAPVTPEQQADVKAAIETAREAARAACRTLPVAGYYQALYAKMLNWSAWYDPGIAIPEVIRAFETAHANHPNVPQVSWLCLQAFSEILDADRDELPAAELTRLEGLLAALGTALLEQEPARSAEVLRELQRVFPEPARLIAVTPPRLLCLEPLYDLLFRQGHYDACAGLIETMAQVNRERVTRQEPKTATLYELIRSHPGSRDEVAVDLARRRLALASALGAEDRYAELRQAELAARRAVCQPLLDAAVAAAAAGDYYRAVRQGRAAALRFPEVPETYVHLAAWKLAMGERRKALEALETLIALPDLPASVLEAALAQVAELPADPRGRGTATLIADVLRVRQAQKRRPAAGRPAALAEVRERLTAWARGGRQIADLARHGHLALYHAGVAAELEGQTTTAAGLYAEALERCPWHRPSVERLLALPDAVGGEVQAELRTQLADAGLDPAALQRDLVVPLPGVVLRHLAVTPAVIDPTQAVRLTVALEVTDELAARPALALTFICADGSRFAGGVAADHWQPATERPRLGQLLVARRELAPTMASLQAGHGLPDGPVTLEIPGTGRDAGFTFYHPAFMVSRGLQPR